MTKSTFTLIAVIALSTTVAFGGEWILFSEELPPGADLALRGDSQFVVSDSQPYHGANHLKRDFATYGDWAWITGIMNLNLDLSGIDFDTAYLEFYIDGGTVAISYLELRLAGPEWDPDFETTSVRVDDQPGYERVRVMLRDFTGRGANSGVRPTNLDEFTGGTGMIDRISWGFGAAGDLFIDEVRILDAAGGVTSLASNPVPAPGEADVSRDAALGWRPGQFANTHDVYLGTGFADVNAADRQSPRGVLISQGQEDTTFASAGLLEFGATYYWRIDEINAPPDSTAFKGEVWSFTVEPYAYPLPNVTATASSAQPGMGPQNTVNGSGLNADDEHSVALTDMWMSAGVQPNWVQYEFDAVYKLHELWVWNSNQIIESLLGFGARDVTIEYSVDGQTWTALEGVPEFARATGSPTYTANTVVDFGGAAAKFVKLTIDQNWGGMAAQSGLSEVRFFHIPVQARVPQPVDEATSIDVNTDLNWRSGREATAHEVYLGTDENALALVDTVTEHRYVPDPLDFGTTYFWKVDEIGGAGPYEGEVWSFTTQEFAIIEGFEDYNDDDNRIYDTWIDGWVNNTGSQVGYDVSPFAETRIVHGGRQSMPLSFNNEESPFYSEAEREFATAQNWTLSGADSLSLWTQDAPSDLYVTVQDSAGKSATVTNPPAATAGQWTQWIIPFSDLAGVNMSRVKKLTIGVGSKAAAVGGGAGTFYVDDIGLGRPVP